MKILCLFAAFVAIDARPQSLFARNFIRSYISQPGRTYGVLPQPLVARPYVGDTVVVDAKPTVVYDSPKRIIYRKISRSRTSSGSKGVTPKLNSLNMQNDDLKYDDGDNASDTTIVESVVNDSPKRIRYRKITCFSADCTTISSGRVSSSRTSSSSNGVTPMLNSLSAGNDDPKYKYDDASDTTDVNDNDEASDTKVVVEAKPTVVYDSLKRIIHRKITCYSNDCHTTSSGSVSSSRTSNGVPPTLNSLNAGNDDPKYKYDDASDTTDDNDEASDTTVVVEAKPTVVYDSPKRIIHRKITCYSDDCHTTSSGSVSSSRTSNGVPPTLNSLKAQNDILKFDDNDTSDTTVVVEAKPTVVYDSPKRIIHRKIKTSSGSSSNRVTPTLNSLNDDLEYELLRLSRLLFSILGPISAKH